MIGKLKSKNSTGDIYNPTDEVVRSDFLLVKKGQLPINRIKYVKLFRKSSNGNSRLEIYSNKGTSITNYPERVLIASDIGRITTHQTDPLGIVMVLKDSTIIFTTDSKESRTNWIKALQEIFFGVDDRRSNDENTLINNEILKNVETFLKVGANENLSLEYGKCATLYLTICNTHLILLDANYKILVKWNIKSIRSYGFNGAEFHFETGRNTENGPKYYSFKVYKNKEKILMRMLENGKQKIRNSGCMISNEESFLYKPQNNKCLELLNKVSQSEYFPSVHGEITSQLFSIHRSSNIQRTTVEEDIYESAINEIEEFYFPSALLHLKNREFPHFSRGQVPKQSDTASYNSIDVNNYENACAVVKDVDKEKSNQLNMNNCISHYKGQLDGQEYAIVRRQSTTDD